MRALPRPPLLVITDRHQTRQPLEAVVRQVLEGGCRWISLREKDLAPDQRLAQLERLMALGVVYGALIGIHGDVDAAHRAGAMHLHLPAGGNPAEARERLGDQVLIGVSAHNLDEVRAARRGGADYCTLSPIFRTPSKPGYDAVPGVQGLAEVAGAAPVPLLALGGIGADRVAECLSAGARGIAVMGGVMRAKDPLEETRRLVAALDA